MINHRQSLLRRDLNDLVRSPDGKVSEAKAFAVLFKAAMLWAFITKIETILGNWEILTVFVTAFVAPDLLKKLLAMRAGLNTPKP